VDARIDAPVDARIDAPVDARTDAAVDAEVGFPNLLAWWKLDDGSGLVATDSSGHGHTGTLANGPAWVPGHVGGGLSFDGVDDLVDAGTTSVFDLTGGFTISAWIYPRSYGGGGYGRIVDRRQGTEQGFSFVVDATRDAVALASNGGTAPQTTWSTTNSITLNSWQHVAATYDGSARSTVLYVGGNVSARGAWSASPISTIARLLLGSDGDALRTFDGVLDDVRIYDRPLSEVEVARIRAEAP
jgi:hypothetical protein